MTSLELIGNIKYMNNRVLDNIKVINNMIDIEEDSGEMSISRAHFLGERQVLRVVNEWFDKLINDYFEEEVRSHDLTTMAELSERKE